MRLDPFIEAEKTAGHSVQRTCGLFEVSKSAYYQRRNGAPSARAVTDAELLEQITAIHAESKGTYGAPRIHKELLHRHVAAGKRKVTRLMRQAGLEGRCKKRWRTTTVADPTAEAARDLIQRHFGPCEDMDRRYVGDITYISTWEGWAYLPRSSTWPAAGSWAGPWPITCAPSWSKTRSPWPLPTEHPRRVSFFTRTAAVNTRVESSPSWPGPTAWCCRSGARANAGTTRWPRASSPPSSVSSSTRAHGRRGPDFVALSSSTPGWYNTSPTPQRRLPQPADYEVPSQRRASGGIINTSNMSVEPDQSQRPAGACWPAARRVHPGECRTAALRGRANWADPPASAWLGAPGGVPLTIDRRPGVMILLFNWPQRLLELALRTLTPAVVRFAQGPSSM